jgi:hypothetical protein
VSDSSDITELITNKEVDFESGDVVADLVPCDTTAVDHVDGIHATAAGFSGESSVPTESSGGSISHVHNGIGGGTGLISMNAEVEHGAQGVCMGFRQCLLLML